MRMLVVGLGAIAQRHITNLKTLEPDCRIAIWRQRPDLPGWVPPAELPVDSYIYGRDDVWEWGPDAAIVANPASLHVSTAIALAANNLPMLIEKPISDRTDGALSVLVEAASRYKFPLMVGYDLRFYQPLIAVKEAIASGRIGRPLSIRCEVGQYLPDWRPGRDYHTSVSAQRALGGGVLLELSHEIDYARWLMGEVVSVSAMTGRISDLEIDVEDTADIVMQFASGALGSIHLDMVDRSLVRGCRVVGTEASIMCGMPTNSTQIWREGRWEVLMDGRDYDSNEPFLAEMRHFLACCRGETSPPVDGADAARTLVVVVAAKRAAEERREVDV